MPGVLDEGDFKRATRAVGLYKETEDLWVLCLSSGILLIITQICIY